MSRRISGCVCITLTPDMLASDVRRLVRHAVDGLETGTALRLDVPRGLVPHVVSDLIPEAVHVQITGPDAFTVAAWRAAVGDAVGVRVSE